MKKILLLLLLNVVFSCCFAQDNPYAVFGYKSNVEYKDSKDDIYWVKNNDLNSDIRTLEFDVTNHLINLFDKKDSLVQSLAVSDDEVLRFLSPDPISNKYPELTPYQFASNTPIQAVDLDGKEAFYVHGTWSEPSTYSKMSIATINTITNNTTTEMFAWSGNNTDQAREQAGKDLAKFVMKNRDPNQPLTLVGQSHGGNVTIIAANILKKQGVQVNILITFNTPSREYQVSKGAANIHVQIYQNDDPVQGLAGNKFNIPDKLFIIPSNYIFPVLLPVFGGTKKGTGEIGGNISRTFKDAFNIELPFDFENIHNSHNTPKLWEGELNRIINIDPVKLPDDKPDYVPTGSDYQNIVPGL
jgi:hypothetical protein